MAFPSEDVAVEESWPTGSVWDWRIQAWDNAWEPGRGSLYVTWMFFSSRKWAVSTLGDLEPLAAAFRANGDFTEALPVAGERLSKVRARRRQQASFLRAVQQRQCPIPAPFLIIKMNNLKERRVH